MKKEYALEETYKTTGGEFTFQEQKRAEEKYFNDHITAYIENGIKEMLTVWGAAGMREIISYEKNSWSIRQQRVQR